MTAQQITSHYDTLRVDRLASAQDIRQAWRRLAQEFHPDRYQGPGDAVTLMAQINQAYEVLCDTTKRVAYDNVLIARLQREQREKALQPKPVLAPATLEKVFGWPAYTVMGTLTVGIAMVASSMLMAPAVARNGGELASVSPSQAPAVSPANSPSAIEVAQIAPIVVRPPTTPQSAEGRVQVQEPVTLVASRSLEFRVAPQRSLRPATEAQEPVLRLVSEPGIKYPPTWRYQQASSGTVVPQ